MTAYHHRERPPHRGLQSVWLLVAGLGDGEWGFSKFWKFWKFCEFCECFFRPLTGAWPRVLCRRSILEKSSHVRQKFERTTVLEHTTSTVLVPFLFFDSRRSSQVRTAIAWGTLIHRPYARTNKGVASKMQDAVEGIIQWARLLLLVLQEGEERRGRYGYGYLRLDPLQKFRNSEMILFCD